VRDDPGFQDADFEVGQQPHKSRVAFAYRHLRHGDAQAGACGGKLRGMAVCAQDELFAPQPRSTVTR
jgi:hypothetical protein